MLKEHKLKPEITLLYQFHAQKALFKVPKICNINLWIENDPPPLWHFSKNSSDLVAGSFPKNETRQPHTANQTNIQILKHKKTGNKQITFLLKLQSLKKGLIK